MSRHVGFIRQPLAWTSIFEWRGSFFPFQFVFPLRFSLVSFPFPILAASDGSDCFFIPGLWMRAAFQKA
ncbi:hypothetical protein [Chromobacterium subtsugae]|uniref:hypothetical protein n=1 Tax=Chromobacterium subtsugae TaxID=251747 RepID=UPI000AB02ADD|nr:hypothetical protein [Chromobacterium subtsugae]